MLLWGPIALSSKSIYKSKASLHSIYVNTIPVCAAFRLECIIKYLEFLGFFPCDWRGLVPRYNRFYWEIGLCVEKCRGHMIYDGARNMTGKLSSVANPIAFTLAHAHVLNICFACPPRYEPFAKWTLVSSLIFFRRNELCIGMKELSSTRRGKKRLNVCRARRVLYQPVIHSFENMLRSSLFYYFSKRLGKISSVPAWCAHTVSVASNQTVHSSRSIFFTQCRKVLGKRCSTPSLSDNGRVAQNLKLRYYLLYSIDEFGIATGHLNAQLKLRSRLLCKWITRFLKVACTVLIYLRCLNFRVCTCVGMHPFLLASHAPLLEPPPPGRLRRIIDPRSDF